MDKLKFALLSIVVLSVLGIGGYWAIVTIQSGTESATVQRAEELKQENEELTKKVTQLESELGTVKAELENLKPKTAEENTPSGTVPEAAVYKNQELINEVQKLVDANVYLHLGSKGAQVGTVQKFLNIYNKTSNKIDNDYGADMVKAVTAFQKAEGLKADGEAGPSTFAKMIDWLKKQG